MLPGLLARAAGAWAWLAGEQQRATSWQLYTFLTLHCHSPQCPRWWLPAIKPTRKNVFINEFQRFWTELFFLLAYSLYATLSKSALSSVRSIAEAQMWEWYWSSHITVCKGANKCISPKYFSLKSMESLYSVKERKNPTRNYLIAQVIWSHLSPYISFSASYELTTMVAAVEIIKKSSDSILRANSWGSSTYSAWRPIWRKSKLTSKGNANDMDDMHGSMW